MGNLGSLASTRETEHEYQVRTCDCTAIMNQAKVFPVVLLASLSGGCSVLSVADAGVTVAANAVKLGANLVGGVSDLARPAWSDSARSSGLNQTSGIALVGSQSTSRAR